MVICGGSAEGYQSSFASIIRNRRLWHATTLTSRRHSSLAPVGVAKWRHDS